MILSTFASCTLLPVPSKDKSSCAVVLSSDGKWKINSFYLDSSGRAKVSLPLELTFPTEELLAEYLAKDCFIPQLSNVVITAESDKKEETADEKAAAAEAAGSEKQEKKESETVAQKSPGPKHSIGIEAKVALTFGTGEAIVGTVEAVDILSSKLQGSKAVVFETDIIVRVSLSGANSETKIRDMSVKATLEIAAVLSTKSADLDDMKSALHSLANLNLAGGMSSSSLIYRRVQFERTEPFSLHASLTNALTVTVTSVPGPHMGQTFLALTVRHSGTHTEDVTITRIALHPTNSKEKTENPSGEIADVTKLVQWGYAPRSDPNLPVLLKCNEAFSTVLAVHATHDMLCRTFVCPVSVSAMLGQKKEDTHPHEVSADVDAEWTTSNAAKFDGFHVDLSLDGHEYRVGAPITVQVKVRNLSKELRDVMLLVDCDDEELAYGDNNDGETHFGVGGLSTAIPSASILIALDIAYVMGVLQGKASAEAALRFIPLREGSVTIPSLKIVDRFSGRYYACFHKLRATVLE